MKINEENYSLFAPASTGSRFVAGFVDFLLCSISTILIFLGVTYQIIKVIPDFVTKDQARDTEMRELYKISEEAGLLTLNEEGITYSKAQLEEFYAYEHILRSFNLNKEYFAENGVNEIELPFDFVKEANTTNDDFYVFYVNFAPDKDIVQYNDLSPFDFYKNVILGTADDIFDIENADNEASIIPFKRTFALDLYKELKQIDESQETITVFDEFYTTTFDNAEKLLRNYSEYSKHYDVYENNYLLSMQYMAYGVLISYFISYMVIYFFPIFISKYGSTLGRVLLKLALFDENSKVCTKSKKAGHLFCGFFLQYFSVLLPFAITLGTNFLNAPFIVDSNFAIFNNTFLGVLSGILAIVCYFSVFVRSDSRSLNDLIRKQELKNAKYYLEK